MKCNATQRKLMTVAPRSCPASWAGLARAKEASVPIAIRSWLTLQADSPLLVSVTFWVEVAPELIVPKSIAVGVHESVQGLVMVAVGGGRGVVVVVLSIITSSSSMVVVRT